MTCFYFEYGISQNCRAVAFLSSWIYSFYFTATVKSMNTDLQICLNKQQPFIILK